MVRNIISVVFHGVNDILRCTKYHFESWSTCVLIVFNFSHCYNNMCRKVAMANIEHMKEFYFNFVHYGNKGSIYVQMKFLDKGFDIENYLFLVRINRRLNQFCLNLNFRLS